MPLASFPSSPITPEASSGFYDGPARTAHTNTTATDTSMSATMHHSPIDPHAMNNPWRGDVTPRDARSESRQANYGSAPSFVKKGSGYFGLGGDGGAQHQHQHSHQSPLEQLTEEGRPDSVIDATSPISPPRTAAATVEGMSVEMQQGPDRRVVVVDISAMPQMGEEPVGFAIAIKDIKRAGHPVHVVTPLSANEDGLVCEWLQSVDLSVGFGSDNDVAAIWHVAAGDDNAKIGVVRAINAAFYCVSAKPTDVALAALVKETSIECCFAIQLDSDQDTATGTNEGHFTPLHSPSSADKAAIHAVQGWAGVGACLAEAKQDGRMLKQKKE